MQIMNYEDFEWNRSVAPNGNMANLDPQKVANVCDKFGIPWWTSSWPYSAGIKAFCLDDRIWNRVIRICKGS